MMSLHPGTSAPPRAPRGTIWPLIIIGFILANASVVALTIYFATSDRSMAVEPDYYQKALQWDRTARQRASADRLGWRADVSLLPPADADPRPRLRVTLRGPAQDGHDPIALTAAAIEVEAFAQARSADRLVTSLSELGDGVYESPMAILRPGLWEVRLTVRRGTDAIAVRSTLRVAEQARGAP